MAVQLVANHPLQSRAEGPTGDVLLMPALPVVDMPEAAQEPGYPLVLLVAAYRPASDGRLGLRSSDTAGKPYEAERNLGVSSHEHRIEMDVLGLEAQAALSGGDYLGAVTAYTRAAQLARADGNTGMAGIFLGYGVNCALLGGIGTGETVARRKKRSRWPASPGCPAQLC